MLFSLPDAAAAPMCVYLERPPCVRGRATGCDTALVKESARGGPLGRGEVTWVGGELQSRLADAGSGECAVHCARPARGVQPGA